jgi:hypothetical protein
MFNWYQDAGMCYTFLPDVSKAPNFSDGRDSEFCHSRWFTRGWCLQELLASKKITFLDADWNVIGNKTSLAALIAMRTGIRDLECWKDQCIAVKFSWMAGRQTTRKEDVAYNLIGICGVNMVPIYGEGERKAFLRLQLSILQESDDKTIFAWNDEKDLGTGRGLLAPTPSAFAASSHMIPVESSPTPKYVVGKNYKTPGYRAPFAMTNKGLHMEVPTLWRSEIAAEDPISRIYWKEIGLPKIDWKEMGVNSLFSESAPRFEETKTPGIMLVPILCTVAGSRNQNRLGIMVRRISGPCYARIGVRFLSNKEQESYLKGGVWVDMYIKQSREEERPFEGRLEVNCNYGGGLSYPWPPGQS